ncbi:hypothetical protein PLICRDRAFT_177507 [Plicaturopsis crispa FD-325 SS-3]|nr:hypothetical protein PLICRDRAFT_177507 [Plicaturopsis crispa FD-325 SS-3]
MLCENRPVVSGSPSSCTIDSALVPLPSFILFCVVGVVVFLRLREHRAKLAGVTRARQYYLLPRGLRILAALLVLATLAMSVLEIIRLALQHEGVALLPVNLAGILVAFAVGVYERRARTRMMISIISAFWLLLAVFGSIKVARLRALVQLRPRPSLLHYPASDQLLDNAVLLGLYIVNAVLEVTTTFFPLWPSTAPSNESHERVTTQG